MQVEFEQNRWAGWPFYVFRGSAALMFCLAVLMLVKSYSAPAGAVTWILMLLGLFLLAGSLPILALRVFVTVRSDPACVEFHYALFTKRLVLGSAHAQVLPAKELIVESRYVSKFGTTYQIKTLATFKGRNQYICLDSYTRETDAKLKCAELAEKLKWVYSGRP